MSVEELIDLLSDFPPEAEVKIEAGDAEVVSAYHADDTVYIASNVVGD